MVVHCDSHAGIGADTSAQNTRLRRVWMRLGALTNDRGLFGGITLAQWRGVLVQSLWHGDRLRDRMDTTDLLVVPRAL